jgi:arginine repressor
MVMFEITIGQGTDIQTFMVMDYEVNSSNEKTTTCKFEVFRGIDLILSLDPNGGLLSICTNPGKLNNETIQQIVDRIESYFL